MYSPWWARGLRLFWVDKVEVTMVGSFLVCWMEGRNQSTRRRQFVWVLAWVGPLPSLTAKRVFYSRRRDLTRKMKMEPCRLPCTGLGPQAPPLYNRDLGNESTHQQLVLRSLASRLRKAFQLCTNGSVRIGSREAAWRLGSVRGVGIVRMQGILDRKSAHCAMEEPVGR